MLDALFVGLFIAAYLAVPLSTYLLLRVGGIDLLRFSVESVTIWFCLIFGYAGTLPLFFGWDRYYNAYGWTDGGLIAALLICAGWSIVGLALGMVVARRLLGFRGRVTSLAPERNSSTELVALCLLLGLCLAVLALYLSQVPRVALVSVLLGQATDTAVERSNMGNAFQGYHRYTVFMEELLTVVVLAFWAAALTSRSWLLWVLTALSGAAAAFVALMGTEKGPIVMLMIHLFVVYLIVKRDGRFITGTTPLVAVAAFGVVILAYVVFMRTSVGTAVAGGLSRTFLGQLTPGYFYLDYFPEHHDFLFGASLPNPGRLFDFQQYPLAVEIMNQIDPSLARRGIVGSAPTMFWGEAYANFGFAGVFVLPFFIGAWVSIVAGLIRLMPSSPLLVGLSVWLAFHFSDLSSTGFGKFVFDFDLIVLLLSIGTAMGLAVMASRLPLFSQGLRRFRQRETPTASRSS